MENHHHHDDQHHDGPEPDEAVLAELVDLDAEVLHAYLSDVIEWVGELAGGQPRRILDLGTGTGTGAFALARRFAGAGVIAVDVSASMLDRLRARARDLGLADRIQAVQADLDTGWPATGPVDLVWASNSLHHVKDPDQVLAGVFGALPPGGLLAVAEMDSFPRFLPDGIGQGIEARLQAVLAEARAAELQHLYSDWGARLSTAGFIIEGRRTFDIDLAAPLPALAGRYAQASLTRLRSGLDGRLSASDLATLGPLLDGDGPDSVLRRDDLNIRTARTAWAARRP
jgi:ubiquinone/menaquinone biosynthesis C-methylase UbiE